MKCEVLKMLNEQLVVPLWPETGQALKLSRRQTYRCAVAGDIEVIKFGKLKRVRTAWLRQKLGLPEAAA
jgi:hypothetical protein